MTWIFAHKTELDKVHEIFGEPTLFGKLFTGPMHDIPINDKQVMFYADMNKYTEWYKKNKE